MTGPRPTLVNFKASPEEIEALSAAAAACGLTLSAFVRSAALAAAGSVEPLEAAERALSEAKARVRALRRAREKK